MVQSIYVDSLFCDFRIRDALVNLRLLPPGNYTIYARHTSRPYTIDNIHRTFVPYTHAAHHSQPRTSTYACLLSSRISTQTNASNSTHRELQKGQGYSPDTRRVQKTSPSTRSPKGLNCNCGSQGIHIPVQPGGSG